MNSFLGGKIRLALVGAVLVVSSCQLLAQGQADQERVNQFISLYREYQAQLATTKNSVLRAEYTESASKLLSLSEQILVLAEGLYDTAGEDYANLVMNYGNAAFLARDYKLAVEQLERSLQMQTLLYGENSPALLSIKLLTIEAAAFLGKQEGSNRFDDDRADALLADVEATYGEDSDELAVYNLNLGIFLIDQLHQGNPTPYITAAYNYFMESDHALRNKSAFYMGKVFMAGADYREAIDVLERAVVAFHATPSEESLFYERTSRAFLARAYSSLGQMDKASQHAVELGRLSVEDQEFTLIYAPRPRYPSGAVRSNREGYSIACFVITKDGTLRDIEVVETEGHSGFADQALNAARSMLYAPRFVDGEPVEVEHCYKFSFEFG